MALTDKLVAIGDAIRSKNGTTEAMSLDAMAAAITNLPSGGGTGFSNYVRVRDTDGALSTSQSISYFDLPTDIVGKPYIFWFNWASSTSNYGIFPTEPVVVGYDGAGNFTTMSDAGNHVVAISLVNDGTRLKCEWTSKAYGAGGSGRFIHVLY